MASANRSAQLAKVHKVLKKRYKPVVVNPQRTVMENLLFACCLEDAKYEAAEEAFAALVHTFFDWNEVRVTSITELAETMACLPDPRAAANRVKRALHSVFETQFNFDLEDRKKKNLGPTIKWLEEMDGSTPFVAAFVVQTALGGHAIPVDGGTMKALRLLDVVTEKEAEKGVAAGFERAIAKAKGAEFGSLLHQFGADFSANPFSPAMKATLLEIDPTVAERLPKRRADSTARKKAAEEQAAAEQAAKKAAPVAKPASAEKGKATPKKKSEPEAAPAKGAKKKSPPPAPQGRARAASREVPGGKKKSASEGLSKRKPR